MLRILRLPSGRRQTQSVVEEIKISVRFLIVGDLFHPGEVLKSPQGVPDAGQNLFPPAQAEHFYVESLRRQGHQVDVFIRNIPAFVGVQMRRSQRFNGTRTLATLAMSLMHRAPRLHPDYWLRNRLLEQRVGQFEPDALVFIGGNRVIFPETLQRIRSRFNCPVIYVSGDSPIVFANKMERLSAPLFDLVIVNDYYHGVQWLELGAARIEVLPMSACEPTYHRAYSLTPDEAARYRSDVGFVGTLVPARLYSRRVQALEAVRDFGLGIWSIHSVPESLAPYYRGPALGEVMLRAICGSTLQLNPNSNFMHYGGNMRLFEAAGCGIFQLTNDTPGVHRWFEIGTHLVTYQTLAQLRDLTAYYLRHEAERQQIAQAAQAHVYAHHTYDHRMTALVELVDGLPHPGGSMAQLGTRSWLQGTPPIPVSEHE